MIYYNSHLTNDERTAIIRERKAQGLKQFHTTMLFYGDNKKADCIVISYETIVGHVYWSDSVMYLRYDALTHSSSTTRQIMRFAKENNLKLIKEK